MLRLLAGLEPISGNNGFMDVYGRAFTVVYVISGLGVIVRSIPKP